jgi:hypothetical protein
MKTQTITNNTWQLYSAKNQLSRIDEYQKLKKPKRSIDCLSGYLDDDDIKLFERDKSAAERGTPIELLD